MTTAGPVNALSAFDSSVVTWSVKLRTPNGVLEESRGIGLCASGKVFEEFVDFGGHRAVEMDGQGRDSLVARLQLRDREQQLLRAFDGKRGNDNGAAASDRRQQRGEKIVERVGRMDAIAVRRFTHENVGGADRVRIVEHRASIPADIAGEDDPPAIELQRDEGRSDDVSGVVIGCARHAEEIERRFQRNGMNEAHRRGNVGLVVIRRRRVRAFVMKAAAMEFALQCGGVVEHDLHQRPWSAASRRPGR